MRELMTSKRVMKIHPVYDVIGYLREQTKTRGEERVDYYKMVAFVCYVSKIEPKNIIETLLDEIWI